MNPQPNTIQSANSAVNTFTRRSFMKTTALTVGAVALLSQGRALGDGQGGNSSSGASQTFDTFVQHVITVSKTVAGEGDPGPYGPGEANTDAKKKLADALTGGGSSNSSTYNPVTANRGPISCFRYFSAQGNSNTLIMGPAFFNGATNKWNQTITVNAGAVVSWQYQE